jgi:hypothetical protein
MQAIPAIKDFENTGTEIVTDENGGTVYTVYRKLYPKNEKVIIEVPATCMVIRQPANTMQPAYDLKPITSYKTNVSMLSGDVQKEIFNSRECAVIKGNDPAGVQWPIQIGVADIYSITVKYFYPGPQELKAKLELYQAGNSRMLAVPVSFTFTNPGKWNQFTVNTSNMINAGNYVVKLVLENAKDLVISGIDIQ